MKKLFTKKIARTLFAGTLAFVMTMALSVNVASAGWNDDPYGDDCQTFSMGNVTTGQGIANPCWTTTTISGKTGDTINVKVYFHNTGSTAVNNATVQITNPGTGAVSGSQSFSGSLKVGGSTVASGSGSVSITSGNVKFRLSRVIIQRQSTNGAIETLANPTDVFSSNGISLGTVQPGWNGQGVLKAVFVLDEASNPGPTGQQPTVATYPVSSLNSASGSATLNGYFNSNGYDTTTSFRYKKTSSSNWITVGTQNKGIVNGASFSHALTGLSGGTYEYQAVAENAYGKVYGNSVTFTISGNNNQGQEPDVDTLEADVSDDDATLNGTFDSNGSDTTTYFQYRKTNSNSWITVGTEDQGDSSGDIEKTIFNLSDGDYEYQAVAENDYGTNTGGIEEFTIGEDGCDNDCGDLSIETRSAEDIDEDSAVLVGKIDDIGAGDVVRWFEYDTNRSDVEDGDGSRVSISDSTNSESEFTKRISGLKEDTTYYFRACGEDDDNNEDCGSVKSFRTDDENNDDEDTDLPDITTLSAIYVGSTTATVDGFYDANGCSVRTYFEYGRTSNLGSTTTSISRGDTSGSMSYSFTALARNTTYFYRAVGTNCEGTVRGVIKSFTTTGGYVVDKPPVVVVHGTGGGNSFIKLMIDNHRDTVRKGYEVIYDVAWENITTRDLKNLILEIRFPEEMTVSDTTEGSIERNGNVVIVELDTLRKKASGEMSITTEITGTLQAGDPVVAQAIMAFENPTTQATENAIAYDSDEFHAEERASNWGNFPSSLAEWLLILLIIIIIIVITHYYTKGRYNNVAVYHQEVPMGPVPQPHNPSQDYVVYRPTPKQ